MILNTIHNIRHYMRLLENIRAAVREKRFGEWEKDYLSQRMTNS